MMGTWGRMPWQEQGWALPVGPRGADPRTSSTVDAGGMSAPHGDVPCWGQAPSQKEREARLAAGRLTGVLGQPTLPAAAFGRWLLLAERPFPALPSSVAGRSGAGGSRDSPLRSPLARSCCHVIKTLPGSAGWDQRLKFAKQRCKDARNPPSLEGHRHHTEDPTGHTAEAKCSSTGWKSREGLSLPVSPVEPQPSSPGD